MDKDNIVVFGIDVSSRKSNVCEMIGQDHVIKSYEISNDQVGFNILLNNLKVFAQKPEIIFKATGVYSERLQSFLDAYHFGYCRLNPPKAKQQLMRFRVNKTDKHDAYRLANSQYIFHRQPECQMASIYKKLKALGHYYDQLTHDLVIVKNRLHRALQESFPDIERLFATPKGENHWQCIIKFTHPELVKTAGLDNITKQLMTLKGVGHHRSTYLAQRLLNLASTTYPSVPVDFPQVDQARDYAQRLITLTSKRKEVVTQMVTMARQLKHDDLSILTSIPGISNTTAVLLLGTLGDIRRFRNPNALNAFVGVDLRHYESGQFIMADHISKRGNTMARKILYRTIGQMASASHYHQCHIADYYLQKKKSSQSRNSKKIAIAAVHKLIRTIYHLIIYGQKYDYQLAKHC